MINEASIWVIIVWIICLFVIAKVTHNIVKESKQSSDYFDSKDRIIDDFYTYKKPK